MLPEENVDEDLDEELEEQKEETECPNCGQDTDGDSVCPNCGAVLCEEEDDDLFPDDGDDLDDEF